MWYERLQRFLYGRYGTDKLSIAILVAGLLLSLIGSLLFWPITLLADALYVWQTLYLSMRCSAPFPGTYLPARESTPPSFGSGPLPKTGCA
mgnify:CR=1 FL=1